MKKCMKCGEVKILSDYYAHKGMRDGTLNKCKECTKSDVKINRSERIEYYRAYDVRRYTIEGVRADKRLEYQRRWRKENPEKYAAHTAVCSAIRLGKLDKPIACSKCGNITESRNLHGHHLDYDQQLDVRWLCARCHAEEHPREEWY